MRKTILTTSVVFIIAMVVFFVLLNPPIDPALLKPASFTYPETADIGCAANSKSGLSGRIDDNKAATGIAYNLRTPTNYKPTVAHPLIVVFAPAGTSAKKSERLVHLTQDATQAGYIIAYANNVRLSLGTIKKLSLIPNDIADKWCIDLSKVYYTGHSDGGTITNALTFLPSAELKPAAIAPSAAGMDTQSLQEYTCPAPLPVMVFHNKGDSHFEGYGKQAADWWANCNQCSNELSTPDKDGCRVYKNCPDSSKTYFCEGPGSHSHWPKKNNVLIDFFNHSN